jgi:hypothetical protein
MIILLLSAYLSEYKIILYIYLPPHLHNENI